MANLDTALRLLEAIETGDLETAMGCYTEDAVQVEWPNALKPKGDLRDVTRMAADFERGKSLLKSQSYELVGSVEDDLIVALEVLWRGVLAVPVGSLKAGDEMVCRSAIVMEFDEGGLILRQRNYDCFEGV